MRPRLHLRLVIAKDHAPQLITRYSGQNEDSLLLAKRLDDSTAAVARPAMPVPVTAVIRKTIPIYLDYAVRTKAIQSVTPQAKVSGYLLKQVASEGSDVKAGDLLYKIDPRNYQAALDQAKAQADRDAAAKGAAEGDKVINGNLQKLGPGSPVRPVSEKMK